jgi:drug/metabolite transporter (DMT)-like permease
MLKEKTASMPLNIKIWVSFFILTLIWGSSFILVKRGLQAFPPDQVASIRLVSAFSVMLFIALKNFKNIPRAQLKYIFFSGFLSLFMTAFFFSFAQMGISSSVAGVLNALTPAFTFIFGVIFFHQKSKLMQIIGLALGFFGSAMLIMLNNKGQFALNVYGFFIVAATLGYGLNVNIVKRYLPDVKPLHMTSVAVSFAGILALPYLLTTNWLSIAYEHPKGMQSLLSIVILGVLGTAVAQIIFNWMLSHSTAVFASSITYFIPIVAVMWGVWDGEYFSIWHILGMACIIGGILILNKNK